MSDMICTAANQKQQSGLCFRCDDVRMIAQLGYIVCEKYHTPFTSRFDRQSPANHLVPIFDPVNWTTLPTPLLSSNYHFHPQHFSPLPWRRSAREEMGGKGVNGLSDWNRLVTMNLMPGSSASNVLRYPYPGNACTRTCTHAQAQYPLS